MERSNEDISRVGEVPRELKRAGRRERVVRESSSLLFCLLRCFVVFGDVKESSGVVVRSKRMAQLGFLEILLCSPSDNVFHE